MDDVERDFPISGKRATPIARSPQTSGLMSTGLPRPLPTTGTQQLGSEPSSATGRQRGETGAVAKQLPMALREAIEAADPALVDQILVQSLPPSIASTLGRRYRDRIDDEYGLYREPIGWVVSAQLEEADRLLSIAMVATTLLPAPERLIKRELARLQLSTKSRASCEDDLVGVLQLLAEACSQYPGDVVTAALRGWARRETFVPSVAELSTELEGIAANRRALLDALRSAAAAQGNHQSEVAWRYLQARVGIDAFRRWFKDVSVVSINSGTVTLAARSRFSAHYLKSNFMIDLCEAWHRSDATIDRVDVVAK